VVVVEVMVVVVTGAGVCGRSRLPASMAGCGFRVTCVKNHARSCDERLAFGRDDAPAS
jgi:hypothetical protein